MREALSYLLVFFVNITSSITIQFLIFVILDKKGKLATWHFESLLLLL